MPAGTLILTPPLAAPAIVGQRVEVYPAAPVKRAMVDLGGDGEAIQVVVPHALAAMLPDGMREDTTREVVLLEDRNVGELHLRDVIAQTASIGLETLPPELDAVASDGVPPEMSPNPVVAPMIGALHVGWEAIENHDLVTYQVFVSTTPGFTAAADTWVADTTATSLVVRTLASELLLVYDVTYYVKIIATDVDGDGPVSVEGSGQIMKATNADIAANYVYAGSLSASQIVGGTISGDVVVGGSLRTADTGARVELDAGGATLYGPDGVPTTDLSTDGQSVFKGDAEIDGLTVKTSMSVRGTANELSTGARLVLAASSTGPSTAPTVVQTWDSITFTDLPPEIEPTQFTSITRLGSQWFVSHDSGTTNRFLLFNSDGTYAGEPDDRLISGLDNASTKITSSGRVYTMKGNGDIVRHKINTADYTYTLTDNFDTGVSSVRWPTQTGLVGWDSGAQRARLDTDTSNPNTRIESATQTITNASVSAKMARSAAELTSQLMVLSVNNSSGYTMVDIYTLGSQIVFTHYDLAGVVDSTSITYNAATHAYWKIADDDGIWRLYTSPDGIAWIQRVAFNHFWNTASRNAVKFQARSSRNASVKNQTVYVDEVRHGPLNEDLVVTYSRVNTSQRPAIGNDGTNILVAEAVPGDLRYRIQVLDPTTLAVTSTITTNINSGFLGPVAGVLKGSFDFGATRYVIKNVGSGVWYPFTTAGAVQAAEVFPADNGGSRGIGWDGSNFWGLGTDGKLYRHTGITFAVGSTGSMAYSAAFTWYDSDTTGGTHETVRSPVANFTLKKRAKITVTSPALPPGSGSDSIDSIRVYTGASSAALTLQSATAAGVNSLVLTTLSTGGAAPPATTNFPASTPARVESASGAMVISGDGTITGALTNTDDTGWITTPVTSIATPSTGWSITSGAVRRLGKQVWCRLVIDRTGSALTVTTTGSISGGAVSMFQMVAAYRPGTGAPLQGGFGGTNTRDVGGRIDDAGIFTLGNVSGSANIATSDQIVVAGTYLLN